MGATRHQPEQRSLPLPQWGGKRAGAGRKPTGPRPGVPHRLRADVAHRFPVHVTLRMREHVWNLRSQRCYRIIEGALAGTNQVGDVRPIHFSVQGNHLHLLVEADDAMALSRGLKGLSVRLARGLNRVMGRKGPVLADRYHAHVLRTPSEVRRAIAYVLGNFVSHAVRRGAQATSDWRDPCSSAALPRGSAGDFRPFAGPVSAPRTWLLREGWRQRAFADAKGANRHFAEREPSGTAPVRVEGPCSRAANVQVRTGGP